MILENQIGNASDAVGVTDTIFLSIGLGGC